MLALSLAECQRRGGEQLTWGITKMHLTKFATLLAALSLGGVANAAVDFDPSADPAAGPIGFVGKGDIQIAFGWNNAVLQSNADGVSFTFEETGSFTLVCSRIHANHGYQEQTFNNKVIGVEAEIDYEQRKNSQGKITGFWLLALGEEEVSGEGCPTGWPDEVSRTPNNNVGTVVGLFAHFEDASWQIWYPEEDEEE